MNRDERERRFTALRAIGCICCAMEGLVGCGPVEVHHQNKGGHAGQERLGDEHTVGLGRWHHRGVPPDGLTAREATNIHGPSLARQSKQFRQRYGSDAQLLARVNRIVAREGVAA